MPKQTSMMGSASPQTTCLGAPEDRGQALKLASPGLTAWEAIGKAPGEDLGLSSVRKVHPES